MELSSIPTKFAIPFASAAGGGYIRPIPQASQIGITNGAASLNDGFPPLTFLPVGSGGTPPWGQDFNGLLKQMTQWTQWQNAGGLVPWDSTFSTEIGGYPQGALVLGSADGTAWLSTADNNTSNPNSGGANWIGLMFSGAFYGADSSGSANEITVNIPGFAAGPTIGQAFWVKIANSITGASLINVNGSGNLPLTQPNGSPLQPGGLLATQIAMCEFDGTNVQVLAPNSSIPVSLITGATYTYLASDRGTLRRRSNSGSSMSDVLTASGLVAGWYMEIGNDDATAILVLQASGGALLDGDGLVYLGPQQRCGIRFDGTNFYTVGRSPRCKLAADTQLFIRTDGNDSNTGLSNSSGSAFATIGGALSRILSTFDTGIYTLSMGLGISGTYAGAAIVGNPYVASLSLAGFVSGCFVTDIPFGAGRSCVGVAGPIAVTADNFTAVYTYTGSALSPEAALTAGGSGQLTIGSSGITTQLNSNRADFSDLFTSTGGLIVIGGQVDITGAATRSSVITAQQGGKFGSAGAFAIDVNSAITVTSGTVVASDLSLVNLQSITYGGSGSVTGPKFSATLGAVIDTGTGNVNLLPGSTAGSTSPGGQYN